MSSEASSRHTRNPNRMWLLDAKSRSLYEFMGDIPDYVILSHTWADEGEVMFKDIHEPHAQSMPGYTKISRCCDQALRDGFQWVWIDTCCINKESSAELTEAINSMYDWYWNAEICYAYLVDVPKTDKATVSECLFSKSRWFTRGWTIQELLAPVVVEFYDQSWTLIGTKASLATIVECATKIDRKYLLNRYLIRDATISTKFSWASKRNTSRPEDTAYCLLGLVGVHMPMLYGEGLQAFYRLQLELLKKSADHTIFAWDPLEGDKYETMGILAPSPRQFKDGANVQPIGPPRRIPIQSIYTTHEMTNRGLRINLPRISTHDHYPFSMALLNCRLGRNEYLGIQLRPFIRGTDRYARVAGSKLRTITAEEAADNYPYTLYIPAESRLITATASSKSRTSIMIKLGRIEQPYWYGTTSIILPSHSFNVDSFRSGPVELTTLRNDGWAQMSFDVWGTEIAVIIGHHERRNYVAVLLRPTANRCTYDALEKMRKDSAFKIDEDFMEWSLHGGIRVQVSMKKRRRLTPGIEILWTAEVHVSKPS